MKKIFLAVLSFFVISSCAKRGTPSGGPEDSIPPVLINASPKLNSINFDSEERIKLTFDEYIKLEKIEDQLIISPPLERKSYDIKPLGGVTKKIFIEFLDTLQENTTYTMNFGNSILDNNEGNPLTFFSYTFSTGETIDSLYIKGNVSDAYNIEADNYVSIHLYRIDSVIKDSTIFNDKPTYVSNTLDSTSYQFQNLKEGNYLIIALKDTDNNYFFDPFYDKIGFIDSIISLPKDSIINFQIFKEETELIWDKPHFINSEKIGFGYYGKLDLNKIEILTSVPDSVKILYTKEKEKDTINLWLSRNSFDSLNFNLIEKDTTKLVTVKFDRERDSLIDSLNISAKTGRLLDLKDSFKLSSNIPIININDSLIQIKDIDSIIVPFTTSISQDRIELEINFDVSPSDNYKLSILPNAFEDIKGVVNDTLNYNFVTQTIEDYGNIFLEVIRNNDSKFILHLINSNGDLIREVKNVNQNSIYNFELLKPGKYLFRLIEDINKNDFWDTGNYLKKIKPEPVYYFPSELEVRANWDLNETFNLNIKQSVNDSIKN
tara:strand:+ start:5821 stop:7461 length:1641 start_codon:yes stop_codon:yes gene_type:complete